MTIHGGGPAFPRVTAEEGIDARQYFAGQALVGLASKVLEGNLVMWELLDDDKELSARCGGLAILCYALADALLEQY